MGTGKMVHWLGVLTTAAEDSQPPLTPVPGEYDALFWTPEALHAHGVHKLTQAHT